VSLPAPRPLGLGDDEPAAGAPPTRVGYYRWVVCALLFFATTINYIDRQVLGLLAPDLQRTLGWSEVDYARLVTIFSAAYAVGLAVAGRILDTIGTRAGLAIAVGLWSLAAMGTALARSLFGFGIARAFLGFFEAANFPASIKAVAEWFPRRERALATGIFNSGTNVGAVIVPVIVPVIALAWGWPAAFLFTGAIGIVWLAWWLLAYAPPERHPRLSARELAHIRSDPEEAVTPVPWLPLLAKRQTWGFIVAKFLTDPVWWFYLYWLPKFFNEKHHLKLSEFSGPLIVIYLLADVGSIGGGWLSSSLIKRGMSVNGARKTAMLICALAVVPVLWVTRVSSVWLAVLLFGLATAAHQGWSANVFTTASDMFPRRAVGSVVGIGGMAGAWGGVFGATIVGYTLQFTGGNYQPLFFICATVYLLALGMVQLLVPRLQPAEV
jgi:ACS family hexuronate transporter-like MFS transporter